MVSFKCDLPGRKKIKAIGDGEVSLRYHLKLKGVYCCQHCFAVKFFALAMDGKIRRTHFLYIYFYDINMDINFYRQQMLLLNSLYFLRSHCY